MNDIIEEYLSLNVGPKPSINRSMKIASRVLCSIQSQKFCINEIAVKLNKTHFYIFYQLIAV